MKVFVTGPDSADSFTYNVAHALREMGHEAVTDPAQGFSMRFSVAWRVLDDLLTRAFRAWRMRTDSRVLRIAEQTRPDLTLMCTQTYEPETVRRIRQITGGAVACWYGDSPANLRRDHVVGGEYDAVFFKDPDFAADLRSMIGLEAHHLPEACNPAWHRPVTGRAGDTVVVAGSSYGYRNAVVRRLLASGESVRVYGPPPPIWAPAEVRAVHTGVYLDQSSKARVFGEALACVSSFAPAERPNSVNCRVFETCACGALLVSEARRALERYFEPGREYLAYESFEECLEHLARARTDEAAIGEIRRRAAERAHGEHTYRHRIEKIFETLELA